MEFVLEIVGSAGRGALRFRVYASRRFGFWSGSAEGRSTGRLAAFGPQEGIPRPDFAAPAL
jgi:hypothetical protein